MIQEVSSSGFGFFLSLSFVSARGAGPLTFAQRDKSKNLSCYTLKNLVTCVISKSTLCAIGSKEETNHRFGFAVPSIKYLFQSFCKPTVYRLSVIVSFLLSASRVLFSARLYLKRLSSIVTAGFLLSLGHISSFTLRCPYSLPSLCSTIVDRWFDILVSFCKVGLLLLTCLFTLMRRGRWLHLHSESAIKK